MALDVQLTWPALPIKLALRKCEAAGLEILSGLVQNLFSVL